MDTGLKGKAALVTAASKGLGQAAARALAAEGARVAITARDAAALDRTAAALRRDTGAEIVTLAGDVTEREHVDRAVARAVESFGGLDILVTNAGGPRSATFDMLTEDDWHRAIDLTLMSVVRLAMAAVPHLRARGGGRIINIASVAVKQPVDGLMLSNALRAAVVGFSKTLATELAPDRILVNCVCPGYTRTDRVTAINEAAAAREGVDVVTVERRLVQQVPLGRLGEPRELADLIAFLASDRASYITGATIQVDGGYVRGLL